MKNTANGIKVYINTIAPIENNDRFFFSFKKTDTSKTSNLIL